MNKEANLGFFKKMSYNDKMKEIQECMLFPLRKYLIFLKVLELIKETIEIEHDKFQIMSCY